MSYLPLYLLTTNFQGQGFQSDTLSCKASQSIFTVTKMILCLVKPFFKGRADEDVSA